MENDGISKTPATGNTAQVDPKADLVNQNDKKFKLDKRLLVGIIAAVLLIVIAGTAMVYRQRNSIHLKPSPSSALLSQQTPKLSSKMFLTSVTKTSVKGSLTVTNQSNFSATNCSLTLFIRGKTVNTPVTLNGKSYHKLTPGPLLSTITQAVPIIGANQTSTVLITISIPSGALSGDDQVESLITSAKGDSLTTTATKLSLVQNL